MPSSSPVPRASRKKKGYWSGTLDCMAVAHIGLGNAKDSAASFLAVPKALGTVGGKEAKTSLKMSRHFFAPPCP